MSNVKFGERGEADKLFVNPYPVYDNEQNSYAEKNIIYYYKLHNRQSIKIKFNHFSLKAISVPLKIRIGRDELDFSTDANLGVLAGYSWGKAKFTHRKKIGIPISWYLLNGWLTNFAYGVELTWRMFALPVLLAILIACITAGIQAFRAVFTNPIDALRKK